MNEEYMSKQQILDLIEDTKETNDVISILKCRIKLFETDEDIVKVIRCEKCVHNSGSEHNPYCDLYYGYHNPNSYCSEGAPKHD